MKPQTSILPRRWTLLGLCLRVFTKLYKKQNALSKLIELEVHTRTDSAIATVIFNTVGILTAVTATELTHMNSLVIALPIIFGITLSYQYAFMSYRIRKLILRAANDPKLAEKVYVIEMAGLSNSTLLSLEKNLLELSEFNQAYRKTTLLLREVEGELRYTDAEEGSEVRQKLIALMEKLRPEIKNRRQIIHTIYQDHEKIINAQKAIEAEKNLKEHHQTALLLESTEIQTKGYEELCHHLDAARQLEKGLGLSLNLDLTK